MRKRPTRASSFLLPLDRQLHSAIDWNPNDPFVAIDPLVRRKNLVLPMEQFFQLTLRTDLKPRFRRLLWCLNHRRRSLSASLFPLQLTEHPPESELDQQTCDC